MVLISFLILYLIPVFLVHIIGWYFWKKRTDYGKTIGDMYEHYGIADGKPLVVFTWVPFVNIFILLMGFIMLFINLISNIKIR
jgi:hypothetical protein